MSEAAPSFGVGDSSSAIHDDDALLDGLNFTADDEQLPDDDEETPLDQFLNADQPDVTPETLKVLEGGRRKPNAAKYERKVQGLFAFGIKLSIANPRTVADSAAMILYGPDISEKAGDLAAVNPRAASIIDMITDQTENPATALIIASVPFLLQVARNHEPVLQPAQRGIRIPFSKGRRIRFKFGFNLGRRMKNMTSEPEALKVRVLTDPGVVAALKKQGINIVSQ